MSLLGGTGTADGAQACRLGRTTLCSPRFASRMDFVLQNHSSYPRVGDKPGQQRLRRAVAARERGEIDAAAFAAIEHAAVDEIIHEQEHAGLDIVTDGQIPWYDPISHVMGAFQGVRINGLLRYFDTNFYFRQPVVQAAVQRRGPIACESFRLATLAARVPVKPVLPGPYTLARFSVIESGTYASVAALAHALSELLAAEIADLVRAGARVIQLDEPAILANPKDIGLLRQLLAPLWAARGTAQLVIATYFGDAEPLYAELNSLPADILALDLTYSPHLLETIAAVGASKILALGLVDGRSTRLEHAGAIAGQVEALLRNYTLTAIHLLPSCGLEYLPRDRAHAKLAVLTNVRRLLTAHQ
jgi:5-methyltetrahydropteroyltriglutamate--homocysteine methyltransferase